MGLGKEMAENAMIEEMVEENLQNLLLVNKQWKTKSGKIIKIKNMSSEHILNSLKLIKKSKFVWRGMFYDLLKEELDKRKIRVD